MARLSLSTLPVSEPVSAPSVTLNSRRNRVLALALAVSATVTSAATTDGGAGCPDEICGMNSNQVLLYGDTAGRLP